MKKKTTAAEKVAEAEKTLRVAALEAGKNIADGFADAMTYIDSDALKNIEIKADIAPPYSYAIQRVVDELGREARNAALYGTFQWPKSSPVGHVANTYESTDEEPEEWIWVEGYKGTNSKMICRDVCFELGKEFHHEGDISLCNSGFHFCQNLENVFYYYDVCNGNRFFKVRALVNKKEYREGSSKDVAKAIIFTEELDPVTIVTTYVEVGKRLGSILENVPEKYFDAVIKNGIWSVMGDIYVDKLVEVGYSRPFATIIVKQYQLFEVAHAVGSQPDLSMDMKVLAILSHNINDKTKISYTPRGGRSR